jgi:hypothetical protein
MHLNPVPQGQGILKPVVGRAVGKRKLYQTKGSRRRRFLGICLVSLAHALQEGELKAQSSCPCLFRTAHWAVFFPEYTEGTRERRTVKDHGGSDDRKRRGGTSKQPQRSTGDRGQGVPRFSTCPAMPEADPSHTWPASLGGGTSPSQDSLLLVQQ